MADGTWWIESNELDDEQSDVIALPPDGNYLVVGPPGSGKTNLLLLRASYLVDAQRPNVLVLTFTRSLREFVVRGSGNYAVAEEKIQTIMRWEQDLLREHTGAIPATDKSFVEVRRERAQQVKAVFDAKPALDGYLDCILVDEVQDCLPEEIELFFRAAKNVFFVGDGRQEIFGKNGTLTLLNGRLEKRELTKHYRNGEQICKVADVIGKNFGEPALIDSCNYDETKAKSSVTFEACKDEAEIFQKLEARLFQQLKAYPDELIGVACPKNDEVSAVRAALLASAKIGPHVLPNDKIFNPTHPSQHIFLCTMHEAKGLEFRAMHLPFGVSKVGETQKKLAYTSVTRAKTSLSVYHVKPLPGYLEQARDKVSPVKPPPTLSNLFPGKK